MRHATIFAAKVAHRRTQIDNGNAPPGQSDGSFRIEIESPHPARLTEHFKQGYDRIDPKSIQRIANSGTQCHQIGENMRDSMAGDPDSGRAFVEYRDAEYHRLRMRLRGSDKCVDIVLRMLAVRIYGHDMRDPLPVRQLQRVKNRRALALVTWQHEDLKVQVMLGYTAKFVAGPIRAAVDDHPDRVFLPADRCDGLEQPRAGVVAGNEHHMARPAAAGPVEIHLTPEPGADHDATFCSRGR